MGYGMAGSLRKYLVYPSEMVWWSNLVNVVFYNSMHNTDEFKAKKMVHGWSYMKFFWVVTLCMFVYEFFPQFFAPLFVYFDWALFNSTYGAGIFAMSFDWTSIGGATLYLPFFSQMNFYGGVILSYWIIFPILWMKNSMNIQNFMPLTSHIYYANGTSFSVTPYLNEDYSLNGTSTMLVNQQG
ncbi:hypothetical protein BGZ76_001258 [Entomortierella beljakovae]|nr:hypothetical protein BGZ76_001258 [Entomortierella beljakovae]